MLIVTSDGVVINVDYFVAAIPQMQAGRETLKVFLRGVETPLIVNESAKQFLERLVNAIEAMEELA